MARDSFERAQEATVLDFDAVFEHVRAVAKAEEVLDPENIKDLSKALTLYFLQSHFPEIDAGEAVECIVDGSNDQGIDAIYIEQTDTNNIVHIVQTKLVMSRDKVLEKRFSANELVKLASKFEDFVVNGAHRDHANEALKLKLDEVDRLENKVYNIITLTTGAPPSHQAIEEFFSKIDRFNLRRKYVDAKFIGLGDLADMLPNVEDPKIDIKIRFEGHVIEAKGGKVQNVVIGMALGSQIANLVKRHGVALFDKNVRGYLRVKNDVNKDIYKSATSEELAPYFFVLNNGITIVCDDVDYMSKTQSPEITIRGAQIVNGGQTSNTLYEALRDGQLNPNVQILIRLIETKDKDVLGKITKATNHQTAVRSRDLRSNDPIQKIIEQIIKDRYGYFYEARKNKYLGIKPAKMRIDMEYLSQTFFAYELQNPSFAKSSKSKLFNDEQYETVFNEKQDIDKLFFAWKLRKSLEFFRKTVSEKYSFVRDAELTSLAMVKIVAPHLHTVEDLRGYEKNGGLLHLYETILEATQSAVNLEVKRLGDKFEKRRFFIAPTTLSKIEVLYGEMTSRK